MNGDTQEVKAEVLKEAIRNNQIQVVNLKLTSDNRLIDAPTTTRSKQSSNNKGVAPQQFSLLTRRIVDKIDRPKALKFQSNKSIEDIYPRAKEFGYDIIEISNDFFLIENSFELILCSSKQIQLDNSSNTDCFPFIIELFMHTNFTSIDFHNTDTSNVTNMSNMFFGCPAKTLDLSSFNTSNVTNRSNMFFGCQAQIKATDNKILDSYKARNQISY